MNTTASSTPDLSHVVRSMKPTRGLLFGALILGALLAFEIFNYTTTDFALADLLGNLRFAGLRWATILAIAFCGIDFAGIARLFTPERGTGEPKEVWYLFGAWLLAATMNAILTWWGVAIAILSHQSLGSTVMDRQLMLKVVPVFVAIMVWVIRVLIIGTFSVAGDRLFSQSATPRHAQPSVMHRQQTSPVAPVPSTSFKPLPKGAPKPVQPMARRTDPNYRPASMSSTNHTSTYE